MGVAVTEAHGQDRLAAAAVIMEQSCSQKQLQFWGGSIYRKTRVLTRTLNSVELNSRSPSRTEAGFQVLPRLWVVERSWGC